MCSWVDGVVDGFQGSSDQTHPPETNGPCVIEPHIIGAKHTLSCQNLLEQTMTKF